MTLGTDARGLLAILRSAPDPLVGVVPPIKVLRRGNGAIRVVLWTLVNVGGRLTDSWDDSERALERIIEAGLLRRVSNDGPFESYFLVSADGHTDLTGTEPVQRHGALAVRTQPRSRGGLTFDRLVDALVVWTGEWPPKQTAVAEKLGMNARSIGKALQRDALRTGVHRTYADALLTAEERRRHQ